MSKKDSYISENTDIQRWSGYEEFEFSSSVEMLKWVRDDKLNFTLSDKVYDAMLECLKENIDSMIVGTLTVIGENQIDILIRKDNFQKIFSAYTKRLIDLEEYEKLSKIKSEIQTFNLEM
jgi:hypothetical protein